MVLTDHSKRDYKQPCFAGACFRKKLHGTYGFLCLFITGEGKINESVSPMLERTEQRGNRGEKGCLLFLQGRFARLSQLPIL